MIQFRTNLFPLYFTATDKTTDTFKDGNNQGILERFNMVIGGDIDDNITPLSTNLIANVIYPATCYDRYVPYLESELGFKPNPTNLWMQNLWLSNDMKVRRALVKILNKLTNVKGTNLAFRVLFGMMGLTHVLTENFGDFGFDSPLTLDDPVRRFDSGCPGCIDATIALTGQPIAGFNVPQAVTSIILWNTPIDVNIKSITLNGSLIYINTGDYNVDFNGDYNVLQD